MTNLTLADLDSLPVVVHAAVWLAHRAQSLQNHALYTCLYFFNCGIVKRKPCFIHLSILFQLWYC